MSIRSSGILNALLIRPWAGESGVFEIVSGERRYRSGLSAGLEFFPCQIRELNDVEVLQIQLIENVQHVGTTPLEESEAYMMLKETGLSVADIAVRIGCTETHVVIRLKLGKLDPVVREAYAKEEISDAHAAQIARLEPADQHLALVYGCLPRLESVRPLPQSNST